MKATLGYITEFHAAHHLPNHLGKCKNLHGHTYTLEVGIYGGVNYDMANPIYGMVLDFHDFKSVVDTAVDLLDHKCLNDVVDYPTAEHTCKWLWEQMEVYLPLKRIRLWETGNTYAEITTEDL